MYIPKIALIRLPTGDPLWDGIPLEDLVASFIKGVKGYPEEVDYFVTISEYWTDLVGSNQNFFNTEINSKLEALGIKTRVEGQQGGSGRQLCDCIRHEFPNFSGDSIYGYYGPLNCVCLYKVLK